MARTAPICPEVHHHRLRIAGLDHFGFKAIVCNAGNILCHVFLSLRAPLTEGKRCPLAVYLDDTAAVRILPFRATSYNRPYSSAEAFQEKSLAMPFACRRRQAVLSPNTVSASCKASSKAGAVYSENLNPVPRPLTGSKGSIVSSRPPVARTTGTVPYRKL